MYVAKNLAHKSLTGCAKNSSLCPCDSLTHVACEHFLCNSGLKANKFKVEDDKCPDKSIISTGPVDETTVRDPTLFRALVVEVKFFQTLQTSDNAHV